MARSLSRYEYTRCYRRGWAFERIGWVMMAVLVFGAVAGIFGNGALSSVEARAGDALATRYPRFARAHAPLELDIEWTPQQRDAAIWISRGYLDQFEIEEVGPAPVEIAIDGERVYYTFRTSRPNDRIHVAFRLRPKRSGRLVGALGVDAETSVELRQLVFP